MVSSKYHLVQPDHAVFASPLKRKYTAVVAKKNHNILTEVEIVSIRRL